MTYWERFSSEFEKLWTQIASLGPLVWVPLYLMAFGLLVAVALGAR